MVIAKFLTTLRNQYFFKMLLIVAMLATYLMPILFFKVLPTQDGPMHVYTAKIMKELIFSDSGLTSQFFDYQSRIHTNIFIQHFLILLQLVADPILAEKILQALYVLLFITSCLYCIKSINSQNTFLVILLLPFTYNFLFYMGFYNFVFSIIPLLLGIGLYFQISASSGRQTVKHILLTLCLIWSFFCHMTSFTVLLGVIISGKLLEHLCFIYRILFKKQSNEKALKYFLSSQNILFWTICTLHTFLLFDFLKLYNKGSAFYQPKLELLVNLINLESLVAFGNTTEQFWTNKLFYILVIITIYLLIRKFFNNNLSRHNFLLVCIFGLIVSYFHLPLYGIGSGMITTRAMLYPFILLVLWFSTYKYKPVEKLLISSIGLIVCLNIYLAQFRVINKVAPILEEFLSAQQFMDNNEVVYPLIVDGNGYDSGYLTVKTGLFLNTSLYLSSFNLGNINLANAAANERFSTIAWKGNIYPLAHGIIMQMPGNVPNLNIDKFSKKTGFNIDKIVVWGSNPKTPAYRHCVEIDNRINQQYSLLWQSATGRMRVYKLNN